MNFLVWQSLNTVHYAVNENICLDISIEIDLSNFLAKLIDISNQRIVNVISAQFLSKFHQNGDCVCDQIAKSQQIIRQNVGVKNYVIRIYHINAQS